jgi:transposase
MGRSRGGLTTKIHALVDACGLPILLKITEGQAHDGRSAADMIDTIGRGDVLLADRAYDCNALRQTLAARGARANVKPMLNRVMALRFSKRLYRKIVGRNKEVRDHDVIITITEARDDH